MVWWWSMFDATIIFRELSRPVSTLLFVAHDCTAVAWVFVCKHSLLYRNRLGTCFSFVVVPVVVVMAAVVFPLLFLLFCRA